MRASSLGRLVFQAMSGRSFWGVVCALRANGAARRVATTRTSRRVMAGHLRVSWDSSTTWGVGAPLFNTEPRRDTEARRFFFGWTLRPPAFRGCAAKQKSVTTILNEEDAESGRAPENLRGSVCLRVSVLKGGLPMRQERPLASQPLFEQRPQFCYRDGLVQVNDLRRHADACPVWAGNHS